MTIEYGERNPLVPRPLAALVVVTAVVGAILTVGALVVGGVRALEASSHHGSMVSGAGGMHGDYAPPEVGGPEKAGGGMHAGGGHMGHHGMQISSEREFLVEMIPHHEEAIDRAGDLLERSSREQMRQFAQDIIDTHTAEVATMRAWLAERYPGQDLTARYEPMMRDLSGLVGDELDRAFLEDMIPHHMTAVMMSQSFVSGDFVEHPDAVPFAEQIRDTQFQEILLMEQWLPEWFGSDAAYRHQMG